MRVKKLGFRWTVTNDYDQMWIYMIVLVFSGHRRTGYFLPGGAVNHLPKKFLQVAQNSRTEIRADATT